MVGTGTTDSLNSNILEKPSCCPLPATPPMSLLPGVHRVASLLKRWILGTHQGSIVLAHLQFYLEEFTFRFNRRPSRSRGLVFRRLLEQAVVTRPVTEADVTDGYDWPHQGISGRSNRLPPPQKKISIHSKMFNQGSLQNNDGDLFEGASGSVSCSRVVQSCIPLGSLP